MYSEVVEKLRQSPRCILQSPHGAGKTFLLRSEGATIVNFDADTLPGAAALVGVEGLEAFTDGEYPNVHAVRLDRICVHLAQWKQVWVTCVCARDLPLPFQAWPVVQLPVPLTVQRRTQLAKQLLRARPCTEEKAQLAQFIAQETVGFLPCDIEALVRGAALVAMAKNMVLSREAIADARPSIIPTPARGVGSTFLKEPRPESELVGLRETV